MRDHDLNRGGLLCWHCSGGKGASWQNAYCQIVTLFSSANDNLSRVWIQWRHFVVDQVLADGVCMAPIWPQVLAVGQVAAAVGEGELRAAVTLRMLENTTLIKGKRGRKLWMALSSWDPPQGWDLQLQNVEGEWGRRSCTPPPTTSCSTAGRIAPLPSFLLLFKETWGTLPSDHSVGGFSSMSCLPTALGGSKPSQHSGATTQSCNKDSLSRKD